MSRRTRLFIDRISLTYRVDRRHRGHVLAACLGLVAQQILRPADWDKELVQGYRKSYAMSLGGSEKLILQLSPKRNANSTQLSMDETHRYLRLEWNPSKASRVNPDSYQQIERLLHELIPEFDPEVFFLTMNITRIDLAFDIRSVPVDNIAVHGLLRRAYIELFRVGPSGTLNGQVLGKRNSLQRLSIYDKNLERETSQNEELPEVVNARARGAKFIPRARTRIELQLRKVGDLSDLLAMPNPFDRYTMRTITGLGAISLTHEFRWFLDSCRVRGLQGALSLISNNRERARYRVAVRSVEPPTWWDTESIWAELGSSIRRAFVGHAAT